MQIERFVNFATCELSLQEFGKLCRKDQSVVRSQKRLHLFTICRNGIFRTSSEFCSRKGAAALCVLCAGSNVTGLLADVSRLTSLIHQYGHSARVFFPKRG